jgi:restriction system protein
MFIPTKENYTEMSPQEFEKFVMELFKITAADIPNVEVNHNEIIKVSDGSYQIDGTIRFELMGAKYLTLVECKMYRKPVSREKVQVLYDKLRAIGAQKGILATTSYFQSGAIEYASAHGIALVQVIDGKLRYGVRSKDIKDIMYPPDIPKFDGISLKSPKKGSIWCSSIVDTQCLSDFLLCNEHVD